jgi:16S rRNA (guanine(966)-N(2))-methyltransferase RsmD
MRIIAGEFKGRRLKAPTWEGLRPTSDKLRETLFNILAPRIADARVLDVFAGTGAVGLESLSRGASQAVFIEEDRRAAALIAHNAALCGVENRCVIIRDRAEHALSRGVGAELFDVVVLDPPYEFEPLASIL